MNRTCTFDFRTQTKSIKDVRVFKGMSVDSAAEKIGIEKELLILYEDSPEDTPISVAKKIASVYNVEYDCISFV